MSLGLPWGVCWKFADVGVASLDCSGDSSWDATYCNALVHFGCLQEIMIRIRGSSPQASDRIEI